MGQIRRMDEHLATLIAAGEVVTGPAAVVRELIDNALDARATTIEVTLEDGGLRSIRVADDGQGMDGADLRLCLQRHATSKIVVADDLESVCTLGFRGEALAAILAVSRMRIETRSAHDAVGFCISGAGGEIGRVRSVARRPGTTVEVAHLFFNTPARREFQDTPRAEASRVLHAVQRAALAHPGLRLRLCDGRRELLNVVPAADLLERIRQIHGNAFADALLSLAASRGEVTVTGYVTHPAAAVRRARRNAFSVNGRPFESFEIRRLLTTQFSPLLTGGSHVEAILRVLLPPREVDANVSPDKAQVRFRRPGLVLATVNDAFRSALSDEAALVRLAPRDRHWGASGQAGPGAPDLTARLAALQRRERGVPGAREAILAASSPEESAEYGAILQGPERLRHRIPPRPPVLLQVSDSFLICPVEGGLLLVDQHSAHERVHYERLRERFDHFGRNPDVQTLLLPERLDLEGDRMALLDEMQPFLQRLGFEIAAGGPRQYLIHAIPAALGERSIARALADLMDIYADARAGGLRSIEVEERITPLEDRLLKTMACHGAVKAGQPLDDVEMHALWRELVRVDLAGHDVHGRPAMLLLPTDEIAHRMGRRVQAV